MCRTDRSLQKSRTPRTCWMLFTYVPYPEHGAGMVRTEWSATYFWLAWTYSSRSSLERSGVP